MSVKIRLLNKKKKRETFVNDEKEGAEEKVLVSDSANNETRVPIARRRLVWNYIPLNKKQGDQDQISDKYCYYC